MPAQARRVVILYSHPLLGEGLARLLGEHRDLSVELVRVTEEPDLEAALAGDPDVVIVERSVALKAIDLLRLAPSALLIDVGLDAGPSWAYHREELSPQPSDILRTIRNGCRTAHVKHRPPTAVPIEDPVKVPAGS